MRPLRVAMVAASTLAACGLAVPACGGDDSGFTGEDAGAGDGTAGDARGDGPSLFGDGGACPQGQACGDGGVCAGGACCAAARVCGSACCGGGDVCSFEKCVTPGAECVDTSDCPAGQYCERSLGPGVDGGAPDAGADGGACIGGSGAPSGRCLPQPPLCAPDAGAPDGGALTCLEKCEYHPPTTAFTPVLAYAWGGQLVSPFSTDVMMAPIIVPLEDTNCDGKTNERDVPDIVFTSFTGGAYTSNGTLHAIAVRNGALVDRWSIPGIANPAAQLAGGELDGSPATRSSRAAPTARCTPITATARRTGRPRPR